MDEGDARAEWLEAKGREEKDVMTDDDGMEYVMTSEGREDLPEELQPGFESSDGLE